MFYTLLGKLVWKSLKLSLRSKYGRTYVPKPVLVGAVLVTVLGALLVLQRRGDSSA